MESSQGGWAGGWRVEGGGAAGQRAEGRGAGGQSKDREEGLEDREQREEGLEDGEQSGRRGCRAESRGRTGWRRGPVREELRFVVIEASGVQVHGESEGGRNNNQKYTRVRRKNRFSKNRCFSSTELYL